MRSNVLIAAVACLAAVVGLQSCFTGIESTPRITDSDVRRVVPPMSDEARLAQRIAPQSLPHWQRGRRFLVTDERLSMLLDRRTEVHRGDTIAFDGLERRLDITGDSITLARFQSIADGRILRMPVASPSTDMTMTFAIDLELVGTADSLLRGKHYYILTPLRVDSQCRPVANGNKFIRVSIDGISAGSELHPLCVAITDDHGDRGYVAMTAGTSVRATRNFDNVFAFSDPHNRYPLITDEVWQHIVYSDVVAGMTVDECRLAIGAPDDLRRWSNGSSILERWTFDRGSYLDFQDGILVDFRL